MSESQNNNPSYNIRNGPAYEQGNEDPRPSGGIAYGRPDMTQTPLTDSTTIDEIKAFYVSIVQSIKVHWGRFDDAFLMTIQERLKEAKSRLDCTYERYKLVSPMMYAELKRQKLLIETDKYCELLRIADRIMWASLTLRNSDAEREKLMIERRHNWEVDHSLLLHRMMYAKVELFDLQTRLHSLKQ